MSTPPPRPTPVGDPPESLAQSLREVFSIAWPTVLTMTSYTIMQFVDMLMVGQVGDLEVAAQGNGGVWAFTPIAIAMGFLTVVNTFVSQHLGAGTVQKGAAYAWGALWIALTSWLTIFVPLIFILPLAFRWMYDPAAIEEYDRLIDMQSMYARYLLAGALFTMGGRALHHYFFGLHKPLVVSVAAVAGNIINVVANYVLIFGENGLPHLGLPGVPGMPALGLEGAAIGTVIGGFIELLVPLIVFLSPKMHREYGTRSAWRLDLSVIRDLARIGWPAAIQYGNEVLCWSIFMTILVGKFGAVHVTAGWIALRYMHLSFMPAVGFSVAVTSLVGKYIGAKRPDVAVSRARLGIGMSMVYMTICAAIFVIWREELVGAFIAPGTDPQRAAAILDIGAKVMICAAFFQTLDALGIVYSGALRGAGDTVWPGVMTMIYAWVFIIGGGWALVTWWPALESIGSWIGAAAYLMALGITMAWRFESGHWRSIDLLGTRGGSADSDPDAATREDARRKAPIGPAPPSPTPDGSIRDIAEEVGEEFGR